MSDIRAQSWNSIVFKHMQEQATEASKWLASVFGEPEWCEGLGLRDTHRLACPPTKTTALIMGGVSEGTNPDPGMTYSQKTPAGDVNRITPVIRDIMKKRGAFSAKEIDEIEQKRFGSVQHVSWLSDEEKKVFKTAFEIDQRILLRYAALRQKHICQGQSLSLFFAEDADPSYVMDCMHYAVDNEDILQLYYFYSKAGVGGAQGECESCQ